MWDKIIHRWMKWPYTLAYQEFSTVKRPRYTIVFIHGIGSSSKMWESIAKKCPDDARLIGVDLLGFGDSPKPSWKVYDTTTHVDSLITTLLMLRVFSPVILVGHSLGSLVAVEFAKKYPSIVKELILCSPPFFRNNDAKLNSDIILKKLYKTVKDNPKNAKKILTLASKYNYINAGFKVDDTNLASYLATLEASIINQTTMKDALLLTQPTKIIIGRLDMFIISKNAKVIAKKNNNVTLTQIAAGHEINQPFSSKIIAAIRQSVENLNKV